MVLKLGELATILIVILAVALGIYAAYLKIQNKRIREESDEFK